MTAAAKTRVMKPAAVRRAELVDLAQGLFLTRGYEATTINDVIAAAGLSKGAFYHHFRAKEDLLAAIAERFARQSLGVVAGLGGAGDALAKLNRLLSLSRDWKRENLAGLKAMFTTLLRPENAVLYHRIADAAFAVMAPALAQIIAEGEAQGVFDPGDPALAAEALLGMSHTRRLVVIRALDGATADLDAATAMIVDRMRAEEALAGRILGLRHGRIDMLGEPAAVRDMLAAWRGRSPNTAL